MTAKILAERYEVQRQLGKQTGRQTLLASNLQTQKLVVIKELFLGSDFEYGIIPLSNCGMGVPPVRYIFPAGGILPKHHPQIVQRPHFPAFCQSHAAVRPDRP